MTSLALTGPYWVTIRQHRRPLTIGACVLILGLAGMTALSAWESSASRNTDSTRYAMLSLAMEGISTASVIVPLLVGAFVAGPLIAREWESGTYTVALTQCVTPARWLTSKLLVAGAATVTGTLALIGIYRIGWLSVDGELPSLWHSWHVFAVSGPVLVAQGLLAVALGALIGQLIRRTVAAMAVTALALGPVLLLLTWLRWELLPTTTRTGPLTASLTDGFALLPAHAKLVDIGLLTATGERYTGFYCYEPFNPGQCRPDVTVVEAYAEYHPASQYWQLQLIETSILLTLAALAVFAAFRVLRRRHP
ncbi:ABC transporter permease [Streptomyces werraensis]|uniref:ABC transporter permease n=1 Tax=Streptomyces werraensis TaxID=68284 RepID=UPI003820A5E6